MKYKFLVFFFGLCLLSCEEDESEAELLGTWQLVETLVDPGDGSGVFRPVSSNKTITFNADGIVTSNGSLCDVFEDVTEPTSGIFSEENMSFTTDECGIEDFEYQFEIEGQFLTYFVLCIEGCAVRFRKI